MLEITTRYSLERNKYVINAMKIGIVKKNKGKLHFQSLAMKKEEMKREKNRVRKNNLLIDFCTTTEKKLYRRFKCFFRYHHRKKKIPKVLK